MVINEDCLEGMKRLPSSSIDMIYLDPPFYTQKLQKLSDSMGCEYSFSDIWTSRFEYLEYMRLRILEMYRLLKPTGSLFLHCDTSASHYLRILLDDIFGENNFRSEIIWTYKRWSNSRKGLLPAHQTIFFYSKSEQFTFNTMYTDYSPTTNIDQIMQERERNCLGKSTYKKGEQGETIYCKEKRGVPLSDVWEIPLLNPKAKERTGYPTQKPIELLERVIKVSTNQNDTILDPFCGSGSSLVAAKLLERQYIGMDINPAAIAITNSRLDSPCKTTSLLLLQGREAYKTKTEKELAILKQFDCDIVQRNRGIDAFLRKRYMDKLVAIKIQKETESLQEAMDLLHRAGLKKHCGIMVLIAREFSVLAQQGKPSNMIILNQLETELNCKLIETLEECAN